MAEEKLIGKIIHYFGNINVGIIELGEELYCGDKIHIKGAGADFEQTVDSMQIEHKDVESAKSGDAVGIKVAQKIKEGDMVYKVM